MSKASMTSESSNTQRLSILALPLNLIAHLLSFLDDPVDLARVCRTCRIFNYMTIPQLYRNPVLTSYDRIRYRDTHPEGWGCASPFSMGLSALVTRSHASLVESLTLRGEWREPELEECSRVGRVPDSAMMLNLSVRAAIDRTKELRSFSWELDTKMLEIVYIGLLQLPKLTSLSIRFPSSRHPRPTFVIPAFPHLRSLKITDIDPLCYPDDISTLLADSRNLRELKLHWSPRMREAQEPSVILHDYFRKAIASKVPMKLKRLGLANLYARHTDEFNDVSDPDILEELTAFNPGFENGNPFVSFLDKGWTAKSASPPLRHKMFRADCLSKYQLEAILSFTSLERVYFVTPGSGRPGDHSQPQNLFIPLACSNGRPSPRVEQNNGTRFPSASVPSSPAPANAQSPPTILIRDAYFSPFVTCHGPTLRHLLLPAKWPLTLNQIGYLVEHCLNLKQLALATEISAQETLKLLLPTLRKLVAVRILIPHSASGKSPFLPHGRAQRCGQPPIPSPYDEENTFRVSSAAGSSYEGDVAVEEEGGGGGEEDEGEEEEALGRILGDNSRFSGLKVIGLGWKGWDLNEFYTTPAVPRANGAKGQASEKPHGNPETSLPPPNRPLAPMRNPHHPRPVPAMGSSGRPTVSFITPTSTYALGPSLGKRPRAPSSASPISLARNLSAAATMDEPSSPSSNRPMERSEAQQFLHVEPITKTLHNGEVVICKRRLCQLPWKILQEWEIWGLDSQEL